MKHSKAFLVISSFVGLLSLFLAIIGCIQRKYAYTIINVSSEPILNKDISGERYYLEIPDMPRLWTWDQCDLVKTESLDSKNIYKFKDIHGTVRLSELQFFIKFEMDDEQMSAEMSQFTDNLACHDCLYIPLVGESLVHSFGSLISILTKEPFSEFAKALSSDLDFIFHFKLGKINKNKMKVVSLPSKSYSSDGKQSYSFAYLEKETKQWFLLQDLSKEEALWKLFYYPAVLCDGAPCIEADLKQITKTDEGVLFHIKNTVSFPYEHFVLTDNSRYIKYVGTSKEFLPSCSARDYFKSAKELNRCIQQYFRSISLLSTADI